MTTQDISISCDNQNLTATLQKYQEAVEDENGTTLMQSSHYLFSTTPPQMWLNCSTFFPAAADSATSKETEYSNLATGNLPVHQGPDTDGLWLATGSNSTCTPSYVHDNNFARALKID